LDFAIASQKKDVYGHKHCSQLIYLFRQKTVGNIGGEFPFTHYLFTRKFFKR